MSDDIVSTRSAVRHCATSPVSPDTTGTAADQGTLPQTASDLPLVGVIGLLALGAAFSLRAFVKRNA